MTGYTSVEPNDDCAVIKEENSVKYAMVPVWILTTRYNNEPYTFMMNGQTGKFVGSLPVDYGKLRNYSVVTFAVATVILYFIMKYLVFG